MNKIIKIEEVEVNYYKFSESELRDFIEKQLNKGHERGYEQGKQLGIKIGKATYRDEIAKMIREFEYELNISGTSKLLNRIINKIANFRV